MVMSDPLSRAYLDELPTRTEYYHELEKIVLVEDFQPREPLVPHEIPSRPWQKVGTDLFLFNGRQYLFTVDYYSSFFEADKLDKADSATAV